LGARAVASVDGETAALTQGPRETMKFGDKAVVAPTSRAPGLTRRTFGFRKGRSRKR
jgi:hypothetical protein